MPRSLPATASLAPSHRACQALAARRPHVLASAGGEAGRESRRRGTRDALSPPDCLPAGSVWLRSPRKPVLSDGSGGSGSSSARLRSPRSPDGDGVAWLASPRTPGHSSSVFFGGEGGGTADATGVRVRSPHHGLFTATTATTAADMPSNPTWQVGGRGMLGSGSVSGGGGRPTPTTRPGGVSGARPGGGRPGGSTTWVRQTLIFVIAACVGAVVFLSARTLWRRERKVGVPMAVLSEGAASVLDDAAVPEFGQAAVNSRLDGGAGLRGPADAGAGAGGVSAGSGGDGNVGLLGPKVVPRRKRRIILSDGNGRWNTGVWPAWGYDPDRVTLNWAAAGVTVKKYCPTQCEFTRDQDASGADAVVMELVNHPKFGISPDIPIPWPEKRANARAAPGQTRPTALPEQVPLTVAFYFEAEQSYPAYTLASEDVRAHVDIAMTPSSASRLPVTLVCPWGRSVFDFLRRPPAKTPGRLLGYFNEHGIASEYRQLRRPLPRRRRPPALLRAPLQPAHAARGRCVVIFRPPAVSTLALLYTPAARTHTHTHNCRRRPVPTGDAAQVHGHVQVHPSDGGAGGARLGGA